MHAGKLQLWSIANPLYPQRVISCKSGVTTLGFAALQPNLLAGTANSSSFTYASFGCLFVPNACAAARAAACRCCGCCCLPLSLLLLVAAAAATPCCVLGGMVDGAVGIWDLRLSRDQPVLHSAGSEGAVVRMSCTYTVAGAADS